MKFKLIHFNFFFLRLFSIVSIGFTIVMLIPILTRDTLPGFGSDPYFCAYIIKQVSNNFSSGILFFESKFWDINLYYPNIRSLALSDPFILQGLIVFILKYFNNNNLIYNINLLFIISFLMNWFLSFLLFKKYCSSKILSLVFSWLFSFSVYNQIQSSHFQNLSFYGLILFIYSIQKLNFKFSFFTLFCITFSLFVLVTSNLYYFLFCLYLSPILIMIMLYTKNYFSNWKRLILIIKNSIIYIIFGIILSSTIIYRYVEVKWIYPELQNQRTFADQINLATRFVDIFSSLNKYWIYPDFYPISLNFERSFFPGMSNLVLGILLTILFLKYKNIFNQREIRFIKIGALFILIIFIISSSPVYLPLISKLLNFVFPPLSSLRAIGRINIFGILFYFLILSILIRKFLLFRFVSNSTYFVVTIIFWLTLFFSSLEMFSFRIDNYKFNIYSISDNLIYLIDSNTNKDSNILILENNSEAEVEKFLKFALLSNFKIINGYSGYSPSSHYITEKSQNFLVSCRYNSSSFRSFKRNIDYLILKIDEKFEELNECLLSNNFKPTSHSSKYTVYKLK
jgi:hypothetical protein